MHMQRKLHHVMSDTKPLCVCPYKLFVCDPLGRTFQCASIRTKFHCASLHECFHRVSFYKRFHCVSFRSNTQPSYNGDVPGEHTLTAFTTPPSRNGAPVYNSQYQFARNF